MTAVSAFDRLNPAQRAAATLRRARGRRPFRAGPLLIIAGAGTGKTNTLAHRVAHLLLQGADPERILLLTFTRRAAQEMTRRAQRIVATAESVGSGDGAAAMRCWSGTFHSIANRLIRRHAAAGRARRAFQVLDRGDAADLMDVVRHELRLSTQDGEALSRARTPASRSTRTASTRSGRWQRRCANAFPWCAEWEDELTRLFRAYVETQARQPGARLRRPAALLARDDGRRGARREIGAHSTTCWWTSTRTPTCCRREILRRCGPRARG